MYEYVRISNRIHVLLVYGTRITMIHDKNKIPEMTTRKTILTFPLTESSPEFQHPPLKLPGCLVICWELTKPSG